MHNVRSVRRPGKLVHTPNERGPLAVSINGNFYTCGTHVGEGPGNEYGMNANECPGSFNANGTGTDYWFGSSGCFISPPTSAFEDFDIGWTTTGDVWGYWNDPDHCGMYFGDAVQFSSPYGGGNYTEYTGYVGYDTVGGQDGYVDDTYCKRLAIDFAPQGLDDPYDVIDYYIEANPGYPIDIEGIENVHNLALPTGLFTYKTFAGTPVDITVYNAYGYITGATGNWLIVLENNASTWQIEAFDQNGNLIGASPTVSGTGLTTDNDITDHTIHVWYNDGGVLKYVVWTYA